MLAHSLWSGSQRPDNMPIMAPLELDRLHTVTKHRPSGAAEALEVPLPAYGTSQETLLKLAEDWDREESERILSSPCFRSSR